MNRTLPQAASLAMLAKSGVSMEMTQDRANVNFTQAMLRAHPSQEAVASAAKAQRKERQRRAQASNPGMNERRVEKSAIGARQFKKTLKAMRRAMKEVGSDTVSVESLA